MTAVSAVPEEDMTSLPQNCDIYFLQLWLPGRQPGGADDDVAAEPLTL